MVNTVFLPPKDCECPHKTELTIDNQYHPWWYNRESLCEPCKKYWGEYQKILEDAIESNKNKPS